MSTHEYDDRGTYRLHRVPSGGWNWSAWDADDFFVARGWTATKSGAIRKAKRQIRRANRDKS